MSRDLPIIFSGPMVRAILDGRKTMTRRVLKPQPPAIVTRLIGPETYHPVAVDRRGDEVPGKPIFGVYDEDGGFGTRVAFQPGQRLWVREAHALDGEAVWYREGHAEAQSKGPRVDVRWRPSIHMPRWACRITIEVGQVRVRRLQDISRDDAMAEGIVQTWGDFMGDPPDWAVASINDHGDASGSHIYDNRTSVQNFRRLWEHINGPGSWEANPWVVALTFRRVGQERA